MNKTVTKTGWAVFTADLNKGIKMNWGGQCSCHKAYLTDDANDVEIFDSEERASMFAQHYLKTHKSNIIFRIQKVMKEQICNVFEIEEEK